MDYSLCKPLQTFFKMYPTIHVSVILQLHKDIASFESTELYDIHTLQRKRLDYLRDVAKNCRIKYYTKLNKQEIIEAILKNRILYQIHLHVVLDLIQNKKYNL